MLANFLRSCKLSKIWQFLFGSTNWPTSAGPYFDTNVVALRRHYCSPPNDARHIPTDLLKSTIILQPPLGCVGLFIFKLLKTVILIESVRCYSCFRLYQDLRSGMIHRGGGQLSGDVARVWRESISKHSKYTDAWSDERGKMRASFQKR